MKLPTSKHAVTIPEWRFLALKDPVVFHRDGSQHPSHEPCRLPGCGTNKGTTEVAS